MTRRRPGRPLNGWLVIDKPQAMTSARVVAGVLRLTGAAKGGHGGTLDPIATGVLPVALGEATKTAGFVLGSTKTYRFTVRWGEARDTDDAGGNVVATIDGRPTAEDIGAVLPEFTGRVIQVPPAYSAVKVKGRRAYALARRGERAILRPREVRVDRLELVEVSDRDHAVFEMQCGKGTYVRALARDIAERLGTVGHIAGLRRTAVGAFREVDSIPLGNLAAVMHGGTLTQHLLPVETALADIPALAVKEAAANRLRNGQAIQVLTAGDGTVRAMASGRLVALAEVKSGEARPLRVFHM